MSTKSVVLKSTIFPEWYSERVMPWVHYVPIKVDYSDLYDVMTFFVGTPDGKGSHDDIAAKLAAQGKEWARTHWRREDMYVVDPKVSDHSTDNAGSSGQATCSDCCLVIS